MENLDAMRDIEAEITESLALLGRWSHLFEKLHPAHKERWKAVVARAQGSGDRLAVRNELDSFIERILKPRVEHLA
jgi:hypothetical protein